LTATRADRPHIVRIRVSSKLDMSASSLVLKATPPGFLEIANRSSGSGTRPAPAMLAVKHAPDPASPD
jgi:hypothetical protein